MLKVKDIMRRVEQTVHVEHQLAEAHLRMTKYGLDFIPVVDGDEVVGILEKSALYFETETTTHAPNGDLVKDRLVGEVVFCYETDTVRTAEDLMMKSGRDSLIVVNGEKRLAGLLTARMVADNRERSETWPATDGRTAAERQTETAGRAKGESPGKPGNYSAEPYVNKNGE